MYRVVEIGLRRTCAPPLEYIMGDGQRPLGRRLVERRDGVDGYLANVVDRVARRLFCRVFARTVRNA